MSKPTTRNEYRLAFWSVFLVAVWALLVILEQNA